MNKPEKKDFPPESPHDIEWGGYNAEKYDRAMEVWEGFNKAKTESSFIPSGSLEEELNTAYDKGLSHAMYVLMEKREIVFDPTRKIIDEMLEEMRLLKHKP